MIAIRSIYYVHSSYCRSTMRKSTTAEHYSSTSTLSPGCCLLYLVSYHYIQQQYIIGVMKSNGGMIHMIRGRGGGQGTLVRERLRYKLY